MKTTYYMRTLGASAIEKSTLDHSKKYEGKMDAARAAAVLAEEQAQVPAAMVASGACLVDDPTCEACQ